MNDKYMMATKAIHQSGDISSDVPDLCVVNSEDNDNYIGQWLFGFGFVNVQFPKNTTRELTPEEIEKYHGNLYFVGESLRCIINITGETYDKQVVLSKSDGSKTYTGTLISPLKVGKAMGILTEDGGWVTTSKITKIDGNQIHTKNSVYILNENPTCK
jgi:hypothetical protein